MTQVTGGGPAASAVSYLYNHTEGLAKALEEADVSELEIEPVQMMRGAFSYSK